MSLLNRSSRIGFAVAAVAAATVCSTASATLYTWNITLDGLQEFPANASPGFGTATITWDSVSHMMSINASFSGLTGTTTAAHIHAATPVAGTGNAGVASQTPSYPGFPLGVTSGSFINTFDMSLGGSYNPAFLTANGGTPASAEAALIAAMFNNQAYLNIHTTTFGGGEIRGLIPSHGTAALLGLGGLAALRRRR